MGSGSSPKLAVEEADWLAELEEPQTPGNRGAVQDLRYTYMVTCSKSTEVLLAGICSSCRGPLLSTML